MLYDPFVFHDSLTIVKGVLRRPSRAHDDNGVRNELLLVARRRHAR
jgi:hypothetical protein